MPGGGEHDVARGAPLAEDAHAYHRTTAEHVEWTAVQAGYAAAGTGSWWSKPSATTFDIGGQLYDPGMQDYTAPAWERPVVVGARWVGAIALTAATGGAAAPAALAWAAGGTAAGAVIGGAVSSSRGGSFWGGVETGGDVGSLVGGFGGAGAKLATRAVQWGARRGVGSATTRVAGLTLPGGAPRALASTPEELAKLKQTLLQVASSGKFVKRAKALGYTDEQIAHVGV